MRYGTAPASRSAAVNPGKRGLKRALASTQKRVRVLCLRGPGTRDRARREFVALQDNDIFKVIADCASGSESADSRSNHDSLFAKRCRHRPLLCELLVALK